MQILAYRVLAKNKFTQTKKAIYNRLFFPLKLDESLYSLILCAG